MVRQYSVISVEDLESKVGSDRANFTFYKDIINKIKQDLDVEFDFENWSMSNDDKIGPVGLMGYCTVNDLVFLGLAAGSDWEPAVYFIVYWDGEKIRAYVPRKGNLWNTNTNMAYGNECDDDGDGNISKSDRQNLISRKDEFGLKIEELNSSRFCIDDIKYNVDLILDDILGEFVKTN